MNQDQVESILRTLLKSAGTYFVTHGFATDGDIQIVIGGIIGALGIYMSWRKHKTPTL